MADDAGQVGGVEAVPFGLLVLVVGILLIAHTWAVVDAKFVTTAAAREATRAFVEAPSTAQARSDAERAAAEVAEASGRPLDGLVRRRVGTGFTRCQPARFEASRTVPAFGLPWRGDRPAVTVRSAHQEVVDPYRDGVPGTAACR
jgi:hypothetical protein